MTFSAGSSAAEAVGKFDYVVAMPDSGLGPLLAQFAVDDSRYVQVVHELQAVAVACGMSLAGARVLVCMESSGLRAACESIARLCVLSRIPLLFLVSGRGTFGEANWWSFDHERQLRALIAMFGFHAADAGTANEVGRLLREGADLVTSRMGSAVVVVAPRALREIADALS